MNLHSLPKIVGSLQGYSLPTFVSDSIAGITVVGLVALPHAMAFAISVVTLFKLPGEKMESRFGGIPGRLLSFTMAPARNNRLRT